MLKRVLYNIVEIKRSKIIDAPLVLDHIYDKRPQPVIAKNVIRDIFGRLVAAQLMQNLGSSGQYKVKKGNNFIFTPKVEIIYHTSNGGVINSSWLSF